MNREEIAIKVVTEIWGWIYLEEYKKWGSPGDDIPIGMHWSADALTREAFSWKGFGKTVEAMAEKDLTDSQLVAYRFAAVDILDIGISKSKEEYWERVHLAALEAIK